MNILTAIILIVVFILIYIIIIEGFSIAFRATGLTREKARYQTISLFTNCGFTTSESELIMEHRGRRKLAAAVMILGHIFAVVFVSFIVALFGNLKVDKIKNEIKPIAFVIGSFLLIIIFFKFPFISKPITNALERKATKRVMRKSKSNIITILDTYGKFTLAEINLYEVPSILKGKSMRDANVKSIYNLNFVTIKRKRKVIDVTADTMIERLDKIVVLGPIDSINALFKKSEAKNYDALINIDKNEITVIDNYGKDAMCEVEIRHVPEILKNKTLEEVNLQGSYNVYVMMRKHGHSTSAVTKDLILKDLDTVIVFGPYQKIKDLFLPEEVNKEAR